MVNGVRGQAQRLGADSHKPRLGDRVSAREKRHLVPLTYQFFGQVGNNSLGSTVELGWNAFIKWRYLGNSHLCGMRTWSYRHPEPALNQDFRFGLQHTAFSRVCIAKTSYTR